MTEAVERTILGALERAELDARERRLAAQAEADRLLEAARTASAELEAGLEARIEDAIAALRLDLLERADRDVAAIEQELTGLDRAAAGGSAGGRGRAERARFDAAVAAVVAAVLGESASAG
jgi:hypothetical protein